MGAQPVLVAFSNQAGSTAGVADVIAAVLRREGLAVDLRQAGAVTDVSGYSAVVLGSGMFVPSRHSDGGGFLARHAAALGSTPVWLFCTGPIGRGRNGAGDAASEPEECSVVAVATAVGARGSAVFGPLGLPGEQDPIERLGPVDLVRVRAWAVEIATVLHGGAAAAKGSRRKAGHRRPLVHA